MNDVPYVERSYTFFQSFSLLHLRSMKHIRTHTNRVTQCYLRHVEHTRLESKGFTHCTLDANYRVCGFTHRPCCCHYSGVDLYWWHRCRRAAPVRRRPSWPLCNRAWTYCRIGRSIASARTRPIGRWTAVCRCVWWPACLNVCYRRRVNMCIYM